MINKNYFIYIFIFLYIVSFDAFSATERYYTEQDKYLNKRKGFEKFYLKSSDINPRSEISINQILDKDGCFGNNISPELVWSYPPLNTKSFAITIIDNNSPTGTGWYHWIVYNIPYKTHKIEVGAGEKKTSFLKHKKHILPKDVKQNMNDYSEKAYSGICPQDDNKHQYKITVYALNVEKLDLEDDATPNMAMLQILKHTIKTATIDDVSYQTEKGKLRDKKQKNKTKQVITAKNNQEIKNKNNRKKNTINYTIRNGNPNIHRATIPNQQKLNNNSNSSINTNKEQIQPNIKQNNHQEQQKTIQTNQQSIQENTQQIQTNKQSVQKNKPQIQEKKQINQENKQVQPNLPTLNTENNIVHENKQNNTKPITQNHPQNINNNSNKVVVKNNKAIENIAVDKNQQKLNNNLSSSINTNKEQTQLDIKQNNNQAQQKTIQTNQQPIQKNTQLQDNKQVQPNLPTLNTKNNVVNNDVKNENNI